MHRLLLTAVAALALTAYGCAAPSAEKSSVGGAGDRAAAKVEDGKSKGKNLSWWQRLRRYHQEPKEKPWVYGDVRPGKGLLSDDEDGFTLYRQGEGQSSDPGKPTKVKR